MNKTFLTKPAEVDRSWYVVDAEGQTLGRLASRIAQVLRGKHKPIYSPSVDCGDFVVVINAEKVAVTGRKMEQKMYYRHSMYPGGLTTTSLRDQLEKHPDRVITSAVKGMLPKNVLGRQMLRKMKVYAGSEHPHSAQAPMALEL
jgi:large subunit ribosomal protein L13